MYTHGNWYSQRKFPILDETYAEIWGSSNQLFEFTTGFTMGKKQGDPLLFYDVKSSISKFRNASRPKGFPKHFRRICSYSKKVFESVYIVPQKKK